VDQPINAIVRFTFLPAKLAEHIGPRMFSVRLFRGPEKALGYVDVDCRLCAGEHCEAAAIIEASGRAWLRVGATADVQIMGRAAREGVMTILWLNDRNSR